MKDMTPLQENLQMAKRTGQRAFDYAMNAREEANKLIMALQHTYNESTGTASQIAADKHDRLMAKANTILHAAEMINEALNKLYNLDMSEFF